VRQCRHAAAAGIQIIIKAKLIFSCSFVPWLQHDCKHEREPSRVQKTISTHNNNNIAIEKEMVVVCDD
jgi:hypothetical protein